MARFFIFDKIAYHSSPVLYQTAIDVLICLTKSVARADQQRFEVGCADRFYTKSLFKTGGARHNMKFTHACFAAISPDDARWNVLID
jgi:hypothetical protein